MSVKRSIKDVVVKVDGDSTEYYDVSALCALLKIKDPLVATVGLCEGVDYKGDESNKLLTLSGAQKIITSSENTPDDMVLSYFKIKSNANEIKIAAASEEVKHLENSSFVAHLRAAFPELEFKTNYVVPGTQHVLDICAIVKNIRKCIVIICDESRSAQIQLNSREYEIIYALETHLYPDITWLSYPDYRSKTIRPSIFSLIASIKASLYDTVALQNKKPARRRAASRSTSPPAKKSTKSTKSAKSDKNGSSKSKSKSKSKTNGKHVDEE